MLLAVAVFFYLNYPGVRDQFMKHEMSLLTPEQKVAMEQMAAAQAAMARASTTAAAPAAAPAPAAPAPTPPPVDPGAPTS